MRAFDVAAHQRAQSRKPTCVLLDGPQSALNFDGDEVAEWTVCIGDDEGEPMDSNVARFRDYGDAVLYAAKLAKQGRFELIDEAMPA